MGRGFLDLPVQIRIYKFPYPFPKFEDGNRILYTASRMYV